MIEPLVLLVNQTRSMRLMFSDGYMVEGVVPQYQNCTTIEHQNDGPPTIVLWPSATTDLLYSAIDLVDRGSFGISKDDSEFPL